MFAGIDFSNIYPVSSHNMGTGIQQTLAAATSDSGDPTYVPHHPITCSSKLYFEEDGSFACEHTTVPADDRRTKRICVHSAACLIIELAYGFDGIDPETGLARYKNPDD